MSVFGDGTPQQELYEYAETVKTDFLLSDKEIGILLLRIATHLLDPYDEIDKKITNKKKGQ